MPKIAKSSRWFTFTVEHPLADIRTHLQKAGVQDAQWITRDTIIEGYIYFPNTRPITRKKQWLPGATYCISTMEDVQKKFNDAPVNSFSTYGPTPLFALRELDAETQASEIIMWLRNSSPKEGVERVPTTPEQDTMQEDEEEDEKPRMMPYAVKLKCGITISQKMVAIMIMDEEERDAAIAAMDYAERSIFDLDYNNIMQDKRDFLIKLIEANRDACRN